MLDLFYTKQFKRDLKKLQKQGKSISKLTDVLTQLQRQEKLNDKYKDHLLTGEFVGFRECHIEPDWLLIYQIQENRLILVLGRSGSHSDLF